MKKIMFNDRYGLTAAVLLSRKTQTRRIVKCPKKFKGVDDVELEFHKRLGADFYYDCVVVDGDGRELGQLPLPYKVGDVVAVAQRYSDVPMDFLLSHLDDPRKRYFEQQLIQQSAGWGNKMFISPEDMPWQVQMTDLWFERLQDISDEDCLHEGVEKWMDGFIVPGIMEHNGRSNVCFDTPRQAFAALIDRICGRGTWEKNPWVFAYEFELLKQNYGRTDR